MEVVAKAFLSYAHADNDREGGRILNLAEKIRDEFETLTGTTIQIFTDQAQVLWGQDFRARLDEALQETAFFIPVLTPTYFVRDECRLEMQRFVTSASALGLDQLLLSIRYVQVPDLREDSTDELKAIAARMQFEPWEEFRLLEETSTPYRTAINRMASRLVSLTQRLESRGSDRREVERGAELISIPTQAHEPVELPEGSGGDVSQAEGQLTPDDEDDAPGLIDLVEDVEPAIGDFTSTLEELAPATNQFNSMFAAATEKMNRANERPNAFAAKVVISRELASEVEEPLSEIERLSKEYSKGLLRLDPGIRALLEIVNLSGGKQRAGFVQNLAGLIAAHRTASASIGTAADVARANSGLSRDLRPVLRRFETAMRNILDSEQVISGWEKLIESDTK